MSFKNAVKFLEQVPHIELKNQVYIYKFWLYRLTFLKKGKLMNDNINIFLRVHWKKVSQWFQKMLFFEKVLKIMQKCEW